MVKIVTDTTCGLPSHITDRYQIPIIPQVINIGSESYLEGVSIDLPTFMQRLQTSRELPKTAAPPPELFAQVFERLVPLGEPILCIHPSTEVSGTVRSATVAAREFPAADIRVIDTRVIAAPLASLVLMAAEMAAGGDSADAIESVVRSMTGRARLYFVVATLEYLVRGGRIGRAKGLVGSLLDVKPILTLHDGVVDQFARARTQHRAVGRLKELVLEEIPRSQSSHLAVMHSGVPARAEALVADLRSQLGAVFAGVDIPFYDVPPAIVVHGGPGLLGVAYFV